MVTMEEVLARVALTPAERALVVEQILAVAVRLDAINAACKIGTSEEAVRAYLEAAKHMEYASNIIQIKMQEAANQIETERGGQ